jgi:hypothetical protein
MRKNLMVYLMIEVENLPARDTVIFVSAGRILALPAFFTPDTDVATFFRLFAIDHFLFIVSHYPFLAFFSLYPPS